MRIDIPLEMLRVGLDFEPRENALKVKCPFHDDQTPSMDVFLPDGNFKCYACQHTGDFVALLARVESKQRFVVASALRARYGDDVKPISIKQIEQFHSGIFAATALIGALAARGVDDTSIRRFRLGVDGDRIVIPIANNAGEYVNLRKYLPDRAENDRRPKMTSMRGRGNRLRIFPYSQLVYKRIVLCGGEVKAMAVAQRLNEHGIGAVCITGSENDWAPGLEGFFEGREVFVCNDIDEVGMLATQSRCRRIQRVNKTVRPIYLPLDPLRFKTGDVNDYIALDPESATERLLALLEAAPSWNEAEIEQAVSVIASPYADDEIYDAELEIIADAAIVNKQIRTTVSVSAIDEVAYYLPKKVQIVCDQNQDMCSICPVFMRNENVMEISETSPTMLALMNTKKQLMRDEIREALAIPNCPSCTFLTIDSCKAIEARAQKPLALAEHAGGKVNIPAVFINYDAELNESYSVTGRILAHPKTQAATMLINRAIAVADALDSFVLEDVETLRQFQVPDGVSIREFLSRQYTYLSNAVTRIYSRERLHAFVDLTFHSVLAIKPSPLDKAVKGWLELLIVGDSAQGKTEVTKSLSEWYQLGVRVDCKNATVAGLIGGLEQMNGRWFSQWGILPTHDRRLVILEEIKGMRAEVFAKLTDTRSSGVAQIPKIRRASANARTRLIAVSNPARLRVTMGNYAFGCQAIPELVPNPEDVRRFDAAMILSKDDISPAVMNRAVQFTDALYSAEDGRKLILWAWTRKIEDIIVQPAAWVECTIQAERLCEEYTDMLPLFDRGSTRFKLLRWATACAARLFSTEDGIKLIVRPEHVQYVVELLEEEYKQPTHGYHAFSKVQERRVYSTDTTEMQKALAQLTPGPQAIDMLLQLHDFEVQDIMDIGGVSRDEAQLVMSRLVRAGAFVREEKFYVKTAPMIEYLRSLQKNGTSYAEPSY